MIEADRIMAKDKAEKAKAILESEIMGEVFKAIEAKAFEEMLRLSHDDDKGRKHCVDRVNAIRALAAELKSIILVGLSATRKAPTL